MSMGRNRARAPMVGWYNPMMLVKAGVDTIVSTTFGRYADQRVMQAVTAGPGVYYDYSAGGAVREVSLAPSPAPSPSPADDGEEQPGPEDDFWVDYVADVGDGWNSTYTIASLLAKPQLDLAVPGGPSQTTDRGRVLVFGGDQVYPVASRQEYRRRLIGPYQAAFANQKDAPHAYAIPGNHDWYDGLVSFSRLFCAGEPFAARADDRSGSPGCPTRQRRSYFALKLPHGWWLLGTDVQLGSDLDAPQLTFFRAVAAKFGDDDRVILCTPEPHWLRPKVEEKREDVDSTALQTLERDVLRRRVSVFVAGDVHHYSRYEADGTHLVTAGGGGAFLHPTHGPWKQTVSVDQGLPVPAAFKPSARRRRRARSHAHNAGTTEFRRATTFPPVKTSRHLGCRNLLFPFLNPLFGMAMAPLYLIFGLLLSQAVSRYQLYAVNQRALLDGAARSSIAIAVQPPSQTDVAGPGPATAPAGGGSANGTAKAAARLDELLEAERMDQQATGNPFATLNDPSRTSQTVKARRAKESRAARDPDRAAMPSTQRFASARPTTGPAKVPTTGPFAKVVAIAKTYAAEADAQAAAAAAATAQLEDAAARAAALEPAKRTEPEPYFASLLGMIVREVLYMPDLNSAIIFWLFATVGLLGFILFTDIPRLRSRVIFGTCHALAHYLAVFTLIWACTYAVWRFDLFSGPNSGKAAPNWFYLSALVVGGWVVGSFIMGLYLFVSLNLFGIHWNEAFSSLGVADWKCFVRMRIDAAGTLTLFPVGVRKVCRRWTDVPDATKGPLVTPVGEIKAELIEAPIVVTPEA